MKKQEFIIEARMFLEKLFVFQKNLIGDDAFNEAKQAFFAPLSYIATQDVKIQTSYLGTDFGGEHPQELAEDFANDFFEDIKYAPIISSEDEIDELCYNFGEFIRDTHINAGMAQMITVEES